MMSVDEMRTLLRTEFGIKTDADLEREMRKIGGIRVAIFTDVPQKGGHAKKAKTVDKNAAACQMVQ